MLKIVPPELLESIFVTVADIKHIRVLVFFKIVIVRNLKYRMILNQSENRETILPSRSIFVLTCKGLICPSILIKMQSFLLFSHC